MPGGLPGGGMLRLRFDRYIIVRAMHARESGEAARSVKRGRQPEKKILFSCLRLAPSVTLVVICLSRAFWSTDQEKKRDCA